MASPHPSRIYGRADLFMVGFEYLHRCDVRASDAKPAAPQSKHGVYLQMPIDQIEMDGSGITDLGLEGNGVVHLFMDYLEYLTMRAFTASREIPRRVASLAVSSRKKVRMPCHFGRSIVPLWGDDGATLR